MAFLRRVAAIHRAILGSFKAALVTMAPTMISRSQGRSATASAAYRVAERIEDRRTGLTFDYAARGGVDHTEILAPDHAPDSRQITAGAAPGELSNRFPRVSLLAGLSRLLVSPARCVNALGQNSVILWWVARWAPSFTDTAPEFR